MADIIIELEVEWEKQRDQEQLEKYCPSGFTGHWIILKSPKGHPEINGGHYSPDFTDTEASIREQFKERYGDRGNIIVNFHISKDERNPTLENFF